MTMKDIIDNPITNNLNAWIQYECTVFVSDQMYPLLYWN